MRSLFGFFFLLVTLTPPISAQVNNAKFELNFSLTHSAKWRLTEYKLSTDPAAEVLYTTSLSKKIWVAGGLFVQTGKHRWQEFTGHTFYDDFGMPYRLHTDFNRQLKFFSVGIPVKIGLNFYNSLFNSFFLGFAAGNHLKLEMADYLHSKFIADLPVTDHYNSLFWEVKSGLGKTLHKTDNFFVSLSPFAGYRKQSPEKFYETGNYNYFFYGLCISSKFGI